MRRLPLILFVSPFLGVMPLGCGSTSASPTSPPDAGNDAGTIPALLAVDAPLGTDVAMDASTDGGGIFIPMTEGQPASVFWDNATQALYISDNQNNQVWRWTDTGGLEKYVTTPGTPDEIDAGATLVGQIVRQSDGTIVVARFGSPKANYGGIAYVRADGGSGMVPEVDPARHHLGIGLAPNDQLF